MDEAMVNPTRNSASWRTPALQPRGKVGPWHRLGNEIALDKIATERRDQVPMRPGFHAFRFPLWSNIGWMFRRIQNLRPDLA